MIPIVKVLKLPTVAAQRHNINTPGIKLTIDNSDSSVDLQYALEENPSHWHKCPAGAMQEWEGDFEQLFYKGAFVAGTDTASIIIERPLDALPNQEEW